MAIWQAVFFRKFENDSFIKFIFIINLKFYNLIQKKTKTNKILFEFN